MMNLGTGKCLMVVWLENGNLELELDCGLDIYFFLSNRMDCGLDDTLLQKGGEDNEGPLRDP